MIAVDGKHISIPEFKKLADGDEETVRHLRSCIEQSEFQERMKYINVMSCIFSTLVFDYFKDYTIEERREAYMIATREISREKWDLTLMLEENERISIPKLECLLELGVRKSNVLSVTGDYGNYEEFKNQIKLLFCVLNYPDFITQIRDHSVYVLDEISFKACEKWREQILIKKMISDGLERIVDSILEESELGKQEGTRNYPFSSN